MTRNISNFILTILLAYLASLFLPWWSLMLASCLAALIIPLKRLAVFLIPFLGIFILWAVQSYILSSANDFILAKKISELLTLGGNPYALIAATGVVGGLAAGISGFLGKQISTIINNE